MIYYTTEHKQYYEGANDIIPYHSIQIVDDIPVVITNMPQIKKEHQDTTYIQHTYYKNNKQKKLTIHNMYKSYP